MTWDAFEAIPRHPAYKVEHLEGETWLTPREAWIHALLRLDHERPAPAATGVLLCRLQPEDWQRLSETFASAFRGVPPFETLDDASAKEALRESLEATHRGEDGPLVASACLLAVGERAGASPCGALLTTLLPGGDPEDWDAWRWRQPPAADAVERRLGRPHLTWVFVQPLERRRGVAGALLTAAISELRALGYAELTSTALAGNLPSVLWHWRQGFQLVKPGR